MTFLLSVPKFRTFAPRLTHSTLVFLNYLAHIYLSGSNGAIQVGNFIGDFVKGNRHSSYPHRIQKGILLHRQIDDFTDRHPIVRETVAFLRPHFGRYSAIVLDMYFDYFLADHFHRISGGKSLRRFARGFYFAALCRYFYLPVRVRRFIFHFITTNRLACYASYEGLHDSLTIMARYKVSALEPDRVIAVLQLHRDYLEQNFHTFFPELQQFVAMC